jgi:SAM-dependent methyltransferase
MIRREAAVGFARAAGAYERARPEYPAAALRWLAGEVGLGPGRDVLDLAAGTGKLTRPLAAMGCRVIAVEPVAEMRARIGPGITALEGTAEAIPRPDASADVVTVGQAFHWFDAPVALAEIARVLRPDGALALVWNRRAVERSELHRAVDAIVAPLRGRAPQHASGAWRDAFVPGALLEREFPFSQRLGPDGLVDRIGSTSEVAALDAPTRATVLERVRALAGGREVDLPHVCEVHVWRPRR